MTWLASLRSNPLIVRSIRQPSKLSMRRGLRYALRLVLAISFLCIFQAFTGRDVSLMAYALLVVAIVMITTPPFVAYTAGTLTVQELRSEQYELVHVTALSNARLVEGHVFRALHRCRFLLLLIASLSPFFILGLLVYQGYVQCSGGRYMPVIYPSCQSFMPLPPDAALLVITGLVIVIGLGGFIFLAAALGVLLAALLPMPGIPNGVAMFGMLIAAIAAGWTLMTAPLQQAFDKAMELTAVVYVAALILMCFAQPFARRRA